MADLRVKIAGFEMKNPLIVASGTYGYGHEFAELYDLSLLGGLAVKGTTLHPRLGNPPPRIAETPAGMLNSVGLQNPGVEALIQEELPFLRQYDTAIIANIAGHSDEEYRQMAERLEGVAGIAALEVNLSCPNIASGGMSFGQDPQNLARVVRLVRQATKLPLIVKLTPNVTSIVDLALAAEEAGADALSLINTLRGMVIDIESRKPVLGTGFGGLSGSAIRPIAVRMVYEVAQAVQIPIIGLGGITSAEDAIQFLLAGASAFQIGAANFHDPLAAPHIITGLNNWLDAHGIASVTELTGQLAWARD